MPLASVTMEQRVSLITLGVTDLERSKAFYGRLGWHGQEVEQTLFLQAGGLAVVLWSRSKLAADSGVPDTAPTAGSGTRFGGIVLAHNVRSASDVDQVMGEAAEAGATITRPAAATFYGGYAGVFADPDGHLWEIAHNPGFQMATDGSITIPDFGAD